MYYVLIDKDGETGSEQVLGVFDSSEISDETLKAYYGNHKVISSQRVEDSGVEWVKKIEMDGVTDTLTMLSFSLNEI